ncbi:MAG TPA: M23 family metallopeptidase [Firmicutes bacterium]|nr:M23 family metallopeptidase [Bacillota bacterium]
MKKKLSHNFFILIVLFSFLSSCTLIIQPYEKNESKVKNEVKNTQTSKRYPPSAKKETTSNSGGFTYTVVKGDTLWSISRRFNADIEELARYNNLSDASLIIVGQKLFIPRSTAPSKTSVQTKSPSSPPSTVKKPAVKSPAPVPQPKPPDKSGASFNFIWPLRSSGRHKVTSHYGQRVDPILNVTTVHTGIDIDANLGDPVLASASGTVVFSGSMKGYGNLIIIKHPDEWHTVYAHLDKIFAEKDRVVKQGEVIGTAGRTGVATGVHLHFEIREGKESKNPLLFLP